MTVRMTPSLSMNYLIIVDLGFMTDGELWFTKPMITKTIGMEKITLTELSITNYLQHEVTTKVGYK